MAGGLWFADRLDVANDVRVDDDREQPGAFCVVANVSAETAYGEGGADVRRGVRHFPAGARVWVLPPQWGDGGEKLVVVGYHRGARGRGLVRMVVSRRHLTGFRVRGVYSPALLRALTRPLTEFGRDDTPTQWRARQEAEETAASWRDLPILARTDDLFWLGMVTDPPPAELRRAEQIYYLAHFNAYRAVYSRQPPPAEP